MGQIQLKTSNLLISILLNGIFSCLCEGGWTAIQDSPSRRYTANGDGHRERSAASSFHTSYHGPYGNTPSPGSHAGGHHGLHLDPIHFIPNNRQGHSYSLSSGRNSHLSSPYHSSYPEYHNFKPSSYSNQIRSHSSLQSDNNDFLHSPLTIQSSAVPHILHDVGLFPSGHISPIVTASPISLGPTHAGFLSASSTLHVADHFTKPIHKGYKVTEDESDDHSDAHTHQVIYVTSQPHHYDDDLHVTSNKNDRSSSHGHDPKATSYQSFVLHSFKPVKVLPKKHPVAHHNDDSYSNEISHKH